VLPPERVSERMCCVCYSGVVLLFVMLCALLCVWAVGVGCAAEGSL
jgi:hypothetical protein